MLRGVVLAQSDGPLRANGFKFLGMAWNAPFKGPVINIELAKEKTRTGDLDGAIALLRTTVDCKFATGEMLFRGEQLPFSLSHYCGAAPRLI